MPHELPLFEVIPTRRYLKQIENYRRTFPRIDEVNEGIVWVLQKDPLWGAEVPDMPSHRILKTYPISPHTEFYVLFEYDESDNKIYLLSIKSTGIIL